MLLISSNSSTNDRLCQVSQSRNKFMLFINLKACYFAKDNEEGIKMFSTMKRIKILEKKFCLSVCLLFQIPGWMPTLYFFKQLYVMFNFQSR